jgi:hypothetical protein
MSCMVRKGNRVTGLKSANLSGIFMVVLLAIGSRSASSGELPRIHRSAGGAQVHDRSHLALVWAGLRPAPAELNFVSSPAVESAGYTRQDDSPLPRIPSEEQIPAISDTAALARDSLSPVTAPLGPPTPGSGARRHARLPSPGGFFRSPTGTLLKSVAFPGWGQWSNGKKQKAAVYFGIETYFLTKALIWRHRALDRLSVWERTNRGDVAALRAAFNTYDSARNSRNYFYWLTGITAFISMFDAYADSYLLILERTRKMGDDYWGGQARFAPDDEMRLAVTWRF